VNYSYEVSVIPRSHLEDEHALRICLGLRLGSWLPSSIERLIQSKEENLIAGRGLTASYVLH
jgi:hypothetical protein